jgi:hypothetical protein
MYVAVLMTATLVTIIGLSALAVTRVQLRSSEGGNNVTVARFCAQSAIEIGIFSISNDANWRATYTHDVLVAEQTLGEGTYTWKLVDEEDLDLAADSNAPVRLYGRGIVGDAVRTYSVLLEADTSKQNLLSNPGFENGLTGWYVLPPGDTDMELDKSDPHSGAACVHLKNRDNRWNGPAQDVTGLVENGVMYAAEFWVDMDSHFDNVRGVFCIESTGGGVAYPQFTRAPGAGWSKITGTLTPVWSGDLISAEWYIGTDFDTEDFRVDDVVVKVANSAVPMVPVPGTWRREVD